MNVVRDLVLSMACLAVLGGCPSPAPADGGDVVAPMDIVMVTDTGVRPDVRPDVHQTGCRANTTCDTCTAVQDCGWSTAAMGCLDGTVDGSLDGSSTGADWAWLAGMCPGSTLCQMQTTCDACTSSGCGWCSGTNHCLPGLAAGSSDGTCSGDSWSLLAQTCPSAVGECAMHSATCGDCTAQRFCGFCPGSGECLPGTSDGPLMGTMQLSCAGWSWLPADCSIPFDAGTPDSTPGDATPDDAAPTDGGPTDASVIDAGPDDVAATDATSPG